ncbi:MAG: dipeptidyl aminopeptidase/acylaminoacyl peptidase [Paracoccaceae bacterium]|jgi:dipeptidyl aminopeptidase/acylaminoacyl peptidase
MIDYLDWQSDLTLEQVFAGAPPFSYPSIVDGMGTLYLSKDPHDNRSVLMLMSDDKVATITPATFNLTTRVNEYGGKPYWLRGSSLVFANRSDQCLYRQQLDGGGTSVPQRISIKPSDTQRFMYTDVNQLNDASVLAIVEVERAEVSHAKNQMFIATLSDQADIEPFIAIEGADFYSNLVVNKSQDKVAWVQWNHPNMPWDNTQLMVADLVCRDKVLSIENPRQVDLFGISSGGASVCQLLFSENDRLFFAADYSSDSLHGSLSGSSSGGEQAPSDDSDNYWNIHVYDFVTAKATRVTSGSDEFGYPHWVYGDHRIVQLTEDTVLAIASAPSGDQMVLIDQHSLKCRRLLPQTPATLQHLHSNGAGRCVLEQLPFDANSSLVQFDYQAIDQSLRPNALIEAANIEFEASQAVAVTFATESTEYAHGFYYAPSNSSQQRQTHAQALPPLLVMVHGGPTARAYGHFDLQKQFWTSRGFAILDVNHRGSSGYGRKFRDSLYGFWGERDSNDIVAGIRHLIEQGKVDPKRICIRGKSAGGYAVLRALTEYPEIFKVGACYYGIGNLVTLAATTHKFEKHYADRLVDEIFNPETSSLPQSKFYQRSPINKMSQLGSAMIVFQGALDRVVPPSVSQEVIGVLQSSGIDHEYVEYADEAHGFKQPNNNIDAWQKELAFYRRILGDKTE